MSLYDKLPKYFVLGVFIAGGAVVLWQLAKPDKATTARAVKVNVPALSAIAINGKTAFDANCASCHGPNAAGSDKGPPLVHDIYNAGHHSDAAFVLAAKIGVRQHHWRYGQMPPQPQVTEEQVTAIVQYVRELQAANGIASGPRRT